MNNVNVTVNIITEILVIALRVWEVWLLWKIYKEAEKLLGVDP